MNSKITEDLDAICKGIDQLARERDEAHAKIKAVADAITPWMLARGITGVHATDAVKLLVDENAALKAHRLSRRGMDMSVLVGFEAGEDSMRDRLAQAEFDARVLAAVVTAWQDAINHGQLVDERFFWNLNMRCESKEAIDARIAQAADALNRWRTK